jgi:hypothetical protein
VGGVIAVEPLQLIAKAAAAHRVGDVAMQIASRETASLQFHIGQFGEILVLNGCRLTVGTDDAELPERNKEPPCSTAQTNDRPR